MLPHSAFAIPSARFMEQHRLLPVAGRVRPPLHAGARLRRGGATLCSVSTTATCPRSPLPAAARGCTAAALSPLSVARSTIARRARSTVLRAGSICAEDDDDDSVTSRRSRDQLRPFLHPDLTAVFKHLPARSRSTKYLKVVACNMLAEYRLFLQASSGALVHFTLVPPHLLLHEEDILVLSARSVLLEEAAEAAMDRELSDLHMHVGIWRGDIAIAMLAKVKLDADADDGAARDELTTVLSIRTGARWTGRPFDVSDDDVFVDLGYMGDALNEHEAALDLLELLDPSADPEDVPKLLCSVADPDSRRLAAFRVPGAASLSVVPINATQRRVLDEMRYDVEAIQGALPSRCEPFRS
jgi:hypothetical protein